MLSLPGPGPTSLTTTPESSKPCAEKTHTKLTEAYLLALRTFAPAPATERAGAT